MTTDAKDTRRGFLGRLGAWLGGLAIVPALGLGRTALAGRTTQLRRMYRRGYGFGVPRYGHGVPGYRLRGHRHTTHRRVFGGYVVPYGGYGVPYGGYGVPYGGGVQIRIGPGVAPGYYGGGYYPMLRRGGGPASPLSLLEA
jgi:hypothetical protein